MKRSWLLVAVAAGLIPSGCRQDKTVTVCAFGPLEISVSPASMSVPVGGRVRVVGTLAGGCGEPLGGFVWEVRDTAVAAVAAAPDSAGLSSAMVTGRSLGSTVLIATSTLDATVKAAAIVSVTQPPE